VPDPIRTTWGHPFLTANGYRNAWRLKSSDSLIAADECGSLFENRIASIRQTDEFEPVYNLRVEENYTYVVQGSVVHCFGFARDVRVSLGRILSHIEQQSRFPNGKTVTA